jgi:hypothetical protein
MVMAHIICKILVILSKCDIVIEKIQIHISSFFIWKFAQMWKINMKREYLITFGFWKKSLDFQKLKIMLWHFLIGFGLVFKK